MLLPILLVFDSFLTEDTYSGELISSLMIVPHISMPPVTKVFEIQLKKGKGCNKVGNFLLMIQRVSYTNPFLHSKVLRLKTDSPQLMQFKNSILELQGRETQYIGLRFAPCHTKTAAEILVFLNSKQDKVEECLAINVTYSE